MQSIANIKSISYLKSHAAQISEDLEMNGNPFVITQNGEAKAVLMGVHEYERMQETLAMLKALCVSGKSFETGKGRPAREVFAGLRAKGKR